MRVEGGGSKGLALKGPGEQEKGKADDEGGRRVDRGVRGGRWC